MTETTKFDSPWKILIEQYFEELMDFFFPKIHTLIDWSRGYEFLDQEFQKIVRDAELGKRLADKLIKVWQKNGEEIILYIHLEVQSQYESGFEQRMFVYHYRIFDRFGQPVISIAILGDENPNWQPHRFGYKKGGCALVFRFPTVKLVNYQTRWEELEQSRNPFSIVVRTHLKALETRQNPEQRFYWKKELVKALYQENYSRKEVLELFRFMDWMLNLPEELATQFDDFVEQQEAEKKVQYITHIERRYIDRARLEVRDNAKEMLIEALEVRFEDIPDNIIEAINAIDDLERLKSLHREAMRCPDLESFKKRLLS